MRRTLADRWNAATGVSHRAQPWHDALRVRRFLFPTLAGLVLLGLWWLPFAIGHVPPGTLPQPTEVARAAVDEATSGRLLDSAIASLFRVAWGFTLAVVVAVPTGLVVGRAIGLRAAVLPWVNFFRSMSPVAWIPFAIVWFGVGDPPAIFLLFYATFFQIVLATVAAVAQVPRVYYRVAEDLGLSRRRTVLHVTFPAILPQLVTALRVAIGVAWMVDVVAEMIAVRSGLGYLIIDARNGLRMDRAVVGMIAIGVIGLSLDALFARLARVPSVRWGFER
jgi:NitT/TauT family transport system permease protein